MHAIVLKTFGPAENLEYDEVETPEPGPGTVRIAVEAAGVHLLDAYLREGGTGGPLPPGELPMVPGREVAGVVDALGSGVDGGWLGRRVVAHLGMASGGYAEFAVAPVTSLHAVPPQLEAAAAVAMIGTGRTAVLLLDGAGIRPDDVVLVTSAAGGLGTLLVQGALHAGATVVGIAGGAEKARRVTELGAQVVADYTAPGWPDRVREALAGRDVTVVLDGLGGDAGRAALELLGEGGRLFIFGWSSGEPTRFTTDDVVARRLSIAMFQRPADLRPLEMRALTEAAAGRLVPAVHPFPLREAAAAHTALESRRTMGKVVLIP